MLAVPPPIMTRWPFAAFNIGQVFLMTGDLRKASTRILLPSPRPSVRKTTLGRSACVGDEKVDTAPRLLDIGSELHSCIRLSQIKRRKFNLGGEQSQFLARRGKLLLAPGSEIASAFEGESACDRRTDSPSRAGHEYTFVFEALHTSLSHPNRRAILRDGVFIMAQLTSQFGMETRTCSATENNFDFVRNSKHVLIQHEVPRIEPNQLGFWQIMQIRLGPGRHEERVLLAPGNQCPGLVSAESGLPLG